MDIKNIIVLICLVMLTSCSSTGSKALKDETQETIASKFQEGVTTKQDIINVLGAPTETTITDGGLEVMKYEFTKFTPKARNFIPYNLFSIVQDGKKKELVILLNESSVVQKLIMNESDIQQRTGIAE